MLKDILKFMGSSLGMIVRFILILALALGGIYCFCTMFLCRFLWEGAVRLSVSILCAVGIAGILAIGRERDGDDVTPDDFRP